MKREGDDLPGQQVKKQKPEEKEEKQEDVFPVGDFDALGDEALVIVILGFLDQKDLLLNAAYVCKKFKQLSYSALHKLDISEWRRRVVEGKPALYSGERHSKIIAQYPVEEICLSYCDLKNLVVYGQSVKKISFVDCENLADSMVEAICGACQNLESIHFCFCKGLKKPNIVGKKIRNVVFLALEKDMQYQVSFDIIKNICLACPALKSIRFSQAHNATRERIEELRKTFPEIEID